ncbi:MAG: hypothetical protein HC926_00185 [Synechococcaceae cyanobacterium SM2_3_60]|nr:hypothetical protein [Synechococcaceae cyanobacterium SM2_3_60]
MNRIFATLIPLSLLAASASFAHETSPSQHSHGQHSHGHSHEHHHTEIEVPTGAAVPSLDVVLHQDSLRGWNLEVITENFAFAPERINEAGDNVNEGHGHLYINDERQTRLYGNWYFLGELEPGDTVRVTLNTNDHADIMHNGQRIEASATVPTP